MSDSSRSYMKFRSIKFLFLCYIKIPSHIYGYIWFRYTRVSYIYFHFWVIPNSVIWNSVIADSVISHSYSVISNSVISKSVISNSLRPKISRDSAEMNLGKAHVSAASVRARGRRLSLSRRYHRARAVCPDGNSCFTGGGGLVFLQPNTFSFRCYRSRLHSCCDEETLSLVLWKLPIHMPLSYSYNVSTM